MGSTVAGLCYREMPPRSVTPRPLPSPTSPFPPSLPSRASTTPHSSTQHCPFCLLVQVPSLDDTLALHKFLLTLPQISKMRAERLLAGLLFCSRVDVESPYKDNVLSLDSCQGNFGWICDKLGSRVLHAHGMEAADAVGIGRFMLPITLTKLLHCMQQAEEACGQHSHRLSLTACLPRLQLLYDPQFIGPAMTWHRCAARTCEEAGVVVQVKGRKGDNRVFRTRHLPAPCLTSVQLPVTHYDTRGKGALSARYVVLDLSYAGTAHAATQGARCRQAQEL